MTDLATAKRVAEPGAAESAAAPREAPAEAAKAKILVVDDEPKSLFALQELLSALGQTLMTEIGRASCRERV